MPQFNIDILPIMSANKLGFSSNYFSIIANLEFFKGNNTTTKLSVMPVNQGGLWQKRKKKHVLILRLHAFSPIFRKNVDI